MSSNEIKKLNTLVVDDHPLYRKAVIDVLFKLGGFGIIDEAENGEVAILKFKDVIYDIVFLDLCMPILDGEEVAKFIKSNFKEVKIIILTGVESKRVVVNLLNLGVNGFIHKNTDENEIKKAINLILEGSQYLTQDVKDKWINYLFSQKNDDIVIQQFITDREKEIMKLLADQLTTKEIADKLCLAESTINTHKKHIMNKINTDTSLGIVMFAIRHGIYIP